MAGLFDFHKTGNNPFGGMAVPQGGAVFPAEQGGGFPEFSPNFLDVVAHQNTDTAMFAQGDWPLEIY